MTTPAASRLAKAGDAISDSFSGIEMNVIKSCAPHFFEAWNLERIAKAALLAFLSEPPTEDEVEAVAKALEPAPFDRRDGGIVPPYQHDAARIKMALKNASFALIASREHLKREIGS